MKHLIILVAALNSTPLWADAQDTESLNSYDAFMQSLQQFCPHCEEALRLTLESLNQKCDFPLTVDNAKFIVTDHPIYALTLSANTMLADNETAKKSFNDAVANSVECWDTPKWLKSLEPTFKERPHQSMGGE